jgi:hypothetical protein
LVVDVASEVDAALEGREWVSSLVSPLSVS